MMNKQQTKGIGRAKYLVALPLAAAFIAVNQMDASARVATEPAPAPRVLQQGEVYKVVDHMPEFPGGVDGILGYIARNVKYPEEMREKGIKGTVICEFVVNTDGSLSDIKVLRGVDPRLDTEAVRVIESMPTWTPGRNGDQAVPTLYTLPIRFGV